jgi:glycosyltransferase involved in cell wall biosynthesis
MGLAADWEVKLLRKRGSEAWLVAPKKSGIESAEYVIRASAISFGNGAIIKGLEKFVEDADIVHLHYPFYGTAGKIAKLKKQGKIKRLVMTLHMDAKANGLSGLAFDFHRQHFQKEIIDAADLLFVSTLDYARTSSFGYLVEQNDPRLHELPFGVETDRFSPLSVIPPMDIGGIQNLDPRVKPEDDKKKFGIPDGAKVIGTVSVMDRAHRFKGIDLLLKAAVDYPSAYILLVGDGNIRAEYERLVADLGIADRVRFAGKLSNEDLITAFRSMDIFAFPSTSGAEAFGIAMLEAMSCGIPVIASALPGVREVAKDAGLLVTPNDVKDLSRAMGEMLNNDQKRQEFAQAARAKALDYDWSKHGDILLSNYRKLCGSPS